MAQGTVKWFNPTKGYGFIQPQGGGKDVFVHISAVERAGLTTLNEGQVVQYEIVSNRGREIGRKPQGLIEPLFERCSKESNRDIVRRSWKFPGRADCSSHRPTDDRPFNPFNMD